MKTLAAMVFLLPAVACAGGRSVKQAFPRCDESMSGVVYTFNGSDKSGVWKVSCLCEAKEGRYRWVNIKTKREGTELLCLG